jgi:hypothetical protein
MIEGEHVNVTSTPTGVGGISTLDVTALMGIFGSMLDRMERNILARLDENARGAAERWRLHDEQLARDRAAVIERFTAVEGHVERVDADMAAHHKAAHEEQLVRQARVRPVQTAAGFLWANWKTILLLVVALLAVLGFVGDTLNRIVGGLP